MLSEPSSADIEMEEQDCVDETIEMTEDQPASVSVTNVPDVVYEDKDTKVNLIFFESNYFEDLT